MKKCILLTILLLLIFVCSAQHTPEKEGKPNAIIITTAEQFNNIRLDLTANYELANDIDLSAYAAEEGWVPFGDMATEFSGSLDGKGYTIKNLKINRPEADFQGLFGQIGMSGQVINLNIEDFHITAMGSLGAVAGMSMGTVKNCIVSGDIITQHGSMLNAAYIGALVGLHTAGTIESCHAEGTISGNSKSVGGLVGTNSYATIKTSSANVTMNFQNDYFIGGLVGTNFANSTIQDCYATGNIIANGNIGVGGCVGSNGGVIKQCYATGNISGNSEDVGGIVGFLDSNGHIENCAAVNPSLMGNAAKIGRVAGRTYNANSILTNNYAWKEMKMNHVAITGNDVQSINGLDKTLIELQTQTTYQTGLSWDFSSIWTICDKLGIPALSWQPFIAISVENPMQICVASSQEIAITSQIGWPLAEITWSYTNNGCFAISSSDNIHYSITALKKGLDTLTISVSGGNTLNLILESIDAPEFLLSTNTFTDCVEEESIALDYTATDYETLQYQIVFSEEALAVGFVNVDYTPLAQSHIFIDLPKQGVAGDYVATLSVKNENNCLKINDITIRLIEATITSQPESLTIVNAGSPFALTVESTYTEQYQWYKNDVPIEGATSPSYHVTAATINDAGFYHVVLSGICEDKISPKYEVVVTSSINDIENNLIITPNPASDYLTIQGDEIERIEIYNIYGKTVKIVTPFQKNIALTDFESGLYVLKIFVANNVINKKILIIR